MRMEDVSRGRECVAPEVNRNKNIGEVGANMNKSAFKRYLAAMAWSAEEVRGGRAQGSVGGREGRG